MPCRGNTCYRAPSNKYSPEDYDNSSDRPDICLHRFPGLN